MLSLQIPAGILLFFLTCTLCLFYLAVQRHRNHIRHRRRLSQQGPFIPAWITHVPLVLHSVAWLLALGLCVFYLAGASFSTDEVLHVGSIILLIAQLAVSISLCARLGACVSPVQTHWRRIWCSYSVVVTSCEIGAIVSFAREWRMENGMINMLPAAVFSAPTTIAVGVFVWTWVNLQVSRTEKTLRAAACAWDVLPLAPFWGWTSQLGSDRITVIVSLQSLHLLLLSIPVSETPMKYVSQWSSSSDKRSITKPDINYVDTARMISKSVDAGGQSSQVELIDCKEDGSAKEAGQDHMI